MNPLIYGYIRVWPDMSDEQAAQIRRELSEYAEHEGFTVAEIFVERPYARSSAFNGLIEAVQRADIKNIVVPDLSHFCYFHDLGKAMKAVIEHHVGAHVWVMNREP